MTTLLPAHAGPDREFALQLTEFLEFGCSVTCYTDDGLIGAGADLIAKAEEGLTADVLVLLLSAASSPARWARERWEPILFDGARQGGTEVVTMLLEECSFPGLLRRRNFLDATSNRLHAMRALKRLLWQRERGAGFGWSAQFSGDLEYLYTALADRAGVLQVSGAAAERFAGEAAGESEAVFWVSCRGRSLAQAAGDLGSQLGLVLESTAAENCDRIRNFLVSRRCLVVLDGAGGEITAALTPGGRTSTAVTREAVQTLQTPETPAYARTLVAARRYAEAYELLYRLLDAVIEPDTCARELTWICEHWDRIEEANALRLNYGPPGQEQLLLF